RHPASAQPRRYSRCAVLIDLSEFRTPVRVEMGPLACLRCDIGPCQAGGRQAGMVPYLRTPLRRWTENGAFAAGTSARGGQIQNRVQFRRANARGKYGMRYEKPTTIEAATALLAGQGARVLAGGTDLLVQMRSRVLNPEVVVDIKGIETTRKVTKDASGYTIGAPASGAELKQHPPRSTDGPRVARAANRH